jgi:hypothetical protein
MAGFGMIAPGVTVDNFGSGARTGFGGFLGRWGDAYRNGMTIGREQGKLNSQYSLDQTKQNTEINKARQIDHARGMQMACQLAGPGSAACQNYEAYKQREQNNPAAAVGVVDQDAENLKLFGFSGTDPKNVGVNPATGRTSAMSYFGAPDTDYAANNAAMSGFDEPFDYRRDDAQGF